jgi:hypothetical protein
MEQRRAYVTTPVDDEIGRRAIARVRRRLIPCTFLLYIVACLDRINIGFASLQMNRDRIGCAMVSSPLPGLTLLPCTAIGIWSALGPSRALPMSILTGPAAAVRFALIDSIGNSGGFVGPSLVGLARAATNGFAGGLFVIAASLLGAAAVALSIPNRRE